MAEHTETGWKWWMRYVIVPIIGGGGIIAIIVALILTSTTPANPPLSKNCPDPEKWEVSYSSLGGANTLEKFFICKTKVLHLQDQWNIHV